MIQLLALTTWIVISVMGQASPGTSTVTTTSPQPSASTTARSNAPPTTQPGAAGAKTRLDPFASIVAAIIAATGTFTVMKVKNRYDQDATRRSEDRSDLVNRHDKQQQRLANRYTEERNRQERRHTTERNELRDQHTIERSELRERYTFERADERSQASAELEELKQQQIKDLERLTSAHETEGHILAERLHSTVEPLKKRLEDERYRHSFAGHSLEDLRILKRLTTADGIPAGLKSDSFVILRRELGSPSVVFRGLIDEVVEVTSVYNTSQLSDLERQELLAQLAIALDKLQVPLTEYADSKADECKSLEVKVAEAETKGELENRELRRRQEERLSQLQEKHVKQITDLNERHGRKRAASMAAERNELDELQARQRSELSILTGKHREEERELDQDQSKQVLELDELQLKELQALKMRES